MSMGDLSDYPNLIDNTDQAKGRCGHFVQVLYEGSHIDRVYCKACDENQALWKQGERLQDQRSKV